VIMPQACRLSFADDKEEEPVYTEPEEHFYNCCSSSDHIYESLDNLVSMDDKMYNEVEEATIRLGLATLRKKKDFDDEDARRERRRVSRRKSFVLERE
jgi:hypothetical protein